jgi:SAM-dependent methyltransferase
VRSEAYGQGGPLSAVDRLGVWLSSVAVRRHASFAGKRVADFGCGYEARLARQVLPCAQHMLLVDLQLADDLKQHPKVQAIEGRIETVLPSVPSESLDVALCLSVLEHLDEPQDALDGLRRILAPGGLVLVNVPTWLGKACLELSAFRLGLSPAGEMDDHKRYYDPRDLWPMLVRAGFLPSAIFCRRHKLGLNTFAACRVPL